MFSAIISVFDHVDSTVVLEVCSKQFCMQTVFQIYSTLFKMNWRTPLHLHSGRQFNNLLKSRVVHVLTKESFGIQLTRTPFLYMK